MPHTADRVALPVHGFDPIGLDELVGEAELLTRVDRKYLVPADAAVRVLAGLDPRSRALEIGGARDFAYDSVYFDTRDHLSYRLTAQRRRRRFKLRTRSYVDTGGTFLEVKTKGGRGETVKQRVGYASVDRARLTPEGVAYAGGVLAQHGHDPALVTEMVPSLVSRYRRVTLLLPGGSRATFDTCLSWSNPTGNDGGDGSGHYERSDVGLHDEGSRAGKRSGIAAETVHLTDHVIIESKSAGTASELDRLLWRAGHRPSGISKFGTGTAALHPELPSNKWARHLRGPFCQTSGACAR